MDMGRVDHVSSPGSTEVWEVHNASFVPHNFHVHGVTFHVIDLDGRHPPTMIGPKDSVAVPPGMRLRLRVTMPYRDDGDHPFMSHCHILLHEDSGMMGRFTLTAAADPPVTFSDHDGHG